MLEPLYTWAVDIIMHIWIGHALRYILMCVCFFSKWVEAFPLPDVVSATVAKTFHREITCRFEMPIGLRSDRGGKFLGDFADYCTKMGI